MKALYLKVGTLSVIFLMICQFAGAQQVFENPKYGKDSASRMECAKNISLYSEFYRQNNFKDAVRDWRKVYNDCPEASINTFIKGATIYKNLIAAEKNANVKNLLIDTLMMVYDKRIQVFGKEGAVLAYKGVDLYGYRGKDAAAQVYAFLKKSCELEKQETKAAVVSTFMQSAVDEYKAGNIDGNAVIEAYELSMATLDLALAANKVDAASGDAKRLNRQKKKLIILVLLIPMLKHYSRKVALLPAKHWLIFLPLNTKKTKLTLTGLKK